MLHSLLLLTALHTSIAGFLLGPITENSAVNQALHSREQGSWNASARLFNRTTTSIWSEPSSNFNAIGQDISSSLNLSLKDALSPSLDIYLNFTDQCLLWDNQCSGNKQEALEIFFNNSGTLYNEVYGAHCIWSRVFSCAPWLPSPAILPNLLEWLRQPECVQSFYDYHTQHADQPPWTWSQRTFDGWSTLTVDWNTIATTTSNVGCCGQCAIRGGDVDVYYWPVPGANSDCISIIGSSFNDPATELVVTDDRGYPYWKPQTNPWGQNTSPNVASITIPPEQALPAGVANPLSEQTYIIKARQYRQNNVTLTTNLSSFEAIATIGDFRCTSPSICIGFSDIYAQDGCGSLSTDGELIQYTMVAFAPEELSTVQIPAWVRASAPPKASIRPFDFADLPCPPQSVMYAVEYKPALGEPYRPVLSAPSRLSSLLPEWSSKGCVIQAALFNGVDPPRALKPAEFLTPKVTQALPLASMAAVPAPASGIQASEPRKTPSPSAGADKEASIQSESETRESDSDVSDPQTSDPEQASPGNTDPKTVGSQTPEELDTDPSNSNHVDQNNPKPAIADPNKSAADTNKPKPSKPDPINLEDATLQPSDPHFVSSQALDAQDETEEAEGSSPKVSNTAEPQRDTSNPNSFHSIVLETPADIASPSHSLPESFLSYDHISPSSTANGQDPSVQNVQEADPAKADTVNLDSTTNESEITDINEKDAAIYPSDKSPPADPKAKSGEKSQNKGTDGQLNLFDVMPTDLPKVDESLSPSGKSVNGQMSDPGQDPSSQPENADDSLPEHSLNDEDRTANQALSLQFLTQTLPTTGSDAMKDLPSETVLPDGSFQLPINSLPTASTYALGDSPRKTTIADSSASAFAATTISVTSASALSSARVATTALHLGSSGLSDSKDQGGNVDSAGSSKVESLGTNLFAARRYLEKRSLRRTQALLYGICIYVLPWFLILL